jgi:CubicO group peptidase (beta-lactamase class C family)
MMASPVAQSGGAYGRGMVWRWVSGTGFGIPEDTFWMSGHDGQHVAIIRSRQLVIVRMGLTPEHEHYRPEPLVRAVLEAVR